MEKQNTETFNTKHILCPFSAKMLPRGSCYLTTHALRWLWRPVFLVEAVGLRLGCFGAGCSLHWRSLSHPYGALWAQAHPRAPRSDVHAFSSYSTARGNPDGEEDWRRRIISNYLNELFNYSTTMNYKSVINQIELEKYHE